MNLSRRSCLSLLASSSVAFSASARAINTLTTFRSLTPKRASLSQWSFHRAIFGDSRNNYEQFLKLLKTSPNDVLQGKLAPRDITLIARNFGIEAIDLVNLCFYGRAQDSAWLAEFNRLADDTGTRFQMLMCDQAGYLGASSKAARQHAIEQHKVWMHTAAELGCRQVRVNAYGDGSYLAQLNQCAESLHTLAEIGKPLELEVLVENHGHPSSNGAWLAMLIENASHDNIGVLTDLDNFFMGGWNLTPERRYDRTQGLLDLAPYTRGVSVKTFDFNAQGAETTIDVPACFKILTDAGFNGYYSAEYEGEHLSEADGTQATIKLIDQALAAR
ncbi:sugar phosphate isomerase/epimerase family protein [Gilvimarinus agarilyticus]|uniref:sugar phosphate isomerase/epimerase family protein n=1 Tax=Gilvimarinus agarilyticus TaxID=679259 RepID=UPI00069896EF|nr:sugar phosphate isomerase/epimerase family protein [Gilvimarinus agarilyticus]